MSLRMTLERILRDDDDATGQTVRSWHIQSDDGHLFIKEAEDSPSFLILRKSDVPRFTKDLQQMATEADETYEFTYVEGCGVSTSDWTPQN